MAYVSGLQQQNLHIVHYGTRRRGCPIIDTVGFKKPHNVGMSLSYIHFINNNNKKCVKKKATDSRHRWRVQMTMKNDK